MNKSRFGLLVVLPLMVTANAPASENGPSDEQLLSKARAASMTLGKALKGRLSQAMKTGGPEKALAVCNLEALPITKQVSEQLGAEVTRTSLKPRSSANAPDKWELKGLKVLQQMNQKGKPLPQLEWGERYTHEGKSWFRYLKAIPTQAVCLTCHGRQIKPELASKINELYPSDKATGYQLGQLRGAFSVSFELPDNN